MLSKLLVTSPSILPSIVMLRKNKSTFVSRCPIRFKKNRPPREGLVFVDTRIGAAIDPSLFRTSHSLLNQYFSVEVPRFLKKNHLSSDHYINIDEDYFPESLGVFAHKYANVQGSTLQAYTVASPAILNDLNNGLYFFIAHEFYDHIGLITS